VLCCVRLARGRRLDLPWWDKVLGMSFKGGKLQLKQLTGGKMDDITVRAAGRGAPASGTGGSDTAGAVGRSCGGSQGTAVLR
jgi:hypothetical protein